MSVLRQLIFRPLWLLSLVYGVLLIVGLALLALRANVGLERHQPIQDHVQHMTALQQIGTYVQEHILAALHDDMPVTAALRAQLHQDIEILLDKDAHLHERTPERVRAIQVAMQDMEAHPREALFELLSEMESIFLQEAQEHEALVNEVHQALVEELEISLVTLGVLVIAITTITMLVRRRVAKPLRLLTGLMDQLADRDYSFARTDKVDPSLLPLIENFNRLVARLQHLEQIEQSQQEALQGQVRNATRTVVAQQQSLANAEKLAVTGEIAAQVAHELRNPLAGIQAVVTNLKTKMTSGDHVYRLELVDDEIKRIADMLNNLLNVARHAPEMPVEFAVDDAISELIELLEIQLPDTITVSFRNPSPIIAVLPRERFRQAILNLVLNSAQAIGDVAGHIEITTDSPRADEVEVSVADDGPGISEELLDDGMLAFATARVHGTGLGLAIVRRFAREFDGDVVIKRRTPTGTQVTVRVRNARTNR